MRPWCPSSSRGFPVTGRTPVIGSTRSWSGTFRSLSGWAILQNAYFGQQSIPKWTLAEAGGDPPRYPNVYRNPFSQISLTVPAEPADDPQRGPLSPRHKPWSTNSTGTTQFEWVALDQSLQWHAFQRVIEVLRARDNDVFVVLGPFNEHLMAAGESSRLSARSTVKLPAWLTGNQIPHFASRAAAQRIVCGCQPSLDRGLSITRKTTLR